MFKKFQKKLFKAVPLCIILFLAAALFSACGAQSKLTGWFNAWIKGTVLITDLY